ncbi:AAA family ATPase [Pseudomonas aeruginosa]|uniref:AAA family ATPase n=1 Tax=Pseudomonas aeruginosa TaxID=287 RepID=UPI0014961DDC|nr:ATP-binding protein [Pseudomonas aeruginosa]NPS65173.1 ATP-binding protein [Pseudomonas aeruginosa]
MARVFVDSIHIKNFKRIESQTVKLKPITALVGGNTSGKSSILQAAQLCTALNQAAFIEDTGRTIKKLKTLALDEVLYRPTEKLLNLRFGEPASQTKNFVLGFDCIVTEENKKQQKLSLSIAVSRGKNANLALNYEGHDALMPILGDRDNPFSILTPGLSGIPLKEEWKTRGALDAAAMHGDANLYLRTLLDHLLHQHLPPEDVELWCAGHYEIEDLPEGSSWRVFSEFLDECYPGAFVYINHNAEKDRYIDVTVYYNGHEFTLDSASTGMLQVIQILAYTCFYAPPLLLLDEPDAHLHADSQSRLHQALKTLTSSTDTRIVLATHSPQLIQLMMDDDDVQIIWMNAGKEIPVPQGQRPAIPMLMELGALGLGAQAFDPKNKLIVLTEDKDAEFARALISANYTKSFACLSYNGCSNLAGARQLAVLLTQLRPDAKIVIHRDRDFRTAPEMAFELRLSEERFKLEGCTNTVEIFTPLNDVEHSFLNLEHLCVALAKMASKEQILQALDEALAIKRDELTARINTARGVIKRDLYDCERMKKKTAIRKTCKLPNSAPKTKAFLPIDGRQPLKLEQCHGKIAFRAFVTELHKLIKGDSGNIQPAIIKPSKFLAIPDWENAFTV